MANMIPAAISQLQESFFRTVNADWDMMESTSTHPCHRLSIPAARLFWCRHCMQIFEDPITRWRHSKTCLHSSGKMRKVKEGSTMQVFLDANDLAELRREQSKSRLMNRSIGPGHSQATDLRCFICKMAFASIEEMRAHVRTPCRKRPTLSVPKHKYSAVPTEVKTQIQIPDTASEIIYIKDGHQTVISLQSPYPTNIIKQIPETPISTSETVIPVLSKNEDVAKQTKNRNENKENNVRKRKRILQKELDDLPNLKTTSISPKSDQQLVTLSLSTKADDDEDVLDDFESPPIKMSKMVNKDHPEEDEASEVQTQPLQTKEDFSQLLTPEKKDNQSSFLEADDHLQNRVITEQIPNESTLLKIPYFPLEEKIVTGDAAEARLKDLFTTMEMQNTNKLSPPSQPLQTVCSFPKSLCKIRNKDMSQNEVLENQSLSTFSVEEDIDPSGLLLYMPPINAGSVTLPDPLLDLQSGLPAEMLLDETTNTKPPTETIHAFVPLNIMEVTKYSHIFDGDLLPSHIHSDVLFEEIIDEKEAQHLVEKELAKLNLEESTSGVDGVTEEYTPVGEALSVEVVSTEIVTPVGEAARIFASIEEIPLPVVVDHIEEIAQPSLVSSIREVPHEKAAAVPIKEIAASIEEAAMVETVAEVLEITAVESLSSVEGATPVDSVSPVQEPPIIEIVFPDKETIPVETLTPAPGTVPCVDKKTTVDTVNQPLESSPSAVQPPSPAEAVSLVEASTLIEAVSPVQAPIPAEALSLVPASTPTEALTRIEAPIALEAVSPVPESVSIEEQEFSKVVEPAPGEAVAPITCAMPIKIDNAVKEMEIIELTPSLKTIEENPVIPPEGSELIQINNEESVLLIDKSLGMSNKGAEVNLEETDNKTKGKQVSDDDELETSLAEKADRETKYKSAKLFKCKACSNTFKTPQALQKHSRIPCKVKHTRSLSQKILRPKQPCLKIEKKPMKKKMIKPTRRPKLLIPIIPITRSELIRPAVPRRPKRFSRRKRKKSFFMDEQHHILPFVNVLMSELSDKDRFFYKLGMINQCRKISCSSETTTGTTANGETSAVEMLGDSAERSSLDVQSSGVKTELTTPPPEIASLCSAQIVAGESQGISSAAFPEAGCVSDKENSSSLAEGPCLSLPTLEKMEDNQFYDPPRDPGKVTGQSPCWEAAPHLAQLHGGMEIVRVTSANPSSADLLTESDTPSKIPVTLESNQNNVLANSQSLPLSDSSACFKEQAMKISKELADDSGLNLSTHIPAKNVSLKCETDKVLNSKEPFENVFQNRDAVSETVSLSLQELVIKEESCSDAVQKDDDANPTDSDLNKKTTQQSPQDLVAETKDWQKASEESQNQLKKVKIYSGINKNSTKYKFNDLQTAKKSLIKSMNLTKNSLNDQNQKETISTTGSDSETGKNECQSADSNVSNSRRKSSASLSKNWTSLSSKKSSDQNESGSSCKKMVSNEESLKATTVLSMMSSNQESPKAAADLSKKMAAIDLCKNAVLNQESLMATALSKQCSVSLRKPTRSQQETLRKDKDELSVVKNSKDLSISSPQNKISSMSTISTRLSPHRKAICNQVLELPQKNVDSETESKKQSPRSQKPENSIGKKHGQSKDKTISKTPQNGKRNSSQISESSQQNLKKNILSALSEKVSIANKESRPKEVTKQKGKSLKLAEPCSERSPTASPSRVTRRTLKSQDSLTDSKDIPKPVEVTSKRNNRSSSANNHKKNLKESPDSFHHEEEDSLSENKAKEIAEVSENQIQISRIEPFVPTSETTPQKSRTLGGKFATRNRQRSGSPCTDRSDLASIPYRRTRSKSDQGGIENSSVSEGNDLILENSMSSNVSRSKSRNIPEPVANSVSVDPQHSSDKEISSFSEQVEHESDNSSVIYALQPHETNKSDLTPESSFACLPVSVSQECDLTLTMKSADETVLKGEELKDDMKPSPTSVDCHSESPRIETTSEKILVNSGAVDAHKTEATTEVTVSNITPTTELSCSDGGGINDTVTDTCPVEYEKPLQNTVVVTLNPRISIATQTDSSFIQETKTGVIVPSDSCDNVENKETPPSSCSNLDVPLPSPPAIGTTPISAEDIPKENIEVLSKNNPNPIADVQPLCVEVEINNDDSHQLSPIAPSSPRATCEHVEDKVVLQENIEISDVPLHQSVPSPGSADSEPLIQQLIDGTIDHNALVQYLSSLDPSILQQGVTFVIIQGAPGEPLQVMDQNNFIIEQTAFSEQVEHESDNSSVIYALQPQSDVVANETEVLMMDSS